MSHGIATSFTHDAVLFKSRVHWPNSEVGAWICGLPDLPLHVRRSSSSSVASAICLTSPRGARLQLTRRRKGTKTKHSGLDALPKLSGLFLTSFWFNRPHSRLEPAIQQACAWNQVGVATTRPDSSCHSMRWHAISRGRHWIANPWSYGTAQTWLIYT
ncbi:unnamed protein product [Prunus armeniaca]